MAVILLILKIIGIILLVLLGLLLLALTLVLFVPVRYRIAGEVGEEISVRIAVTWLLHLVSFRSAYEEGEMKSVLRILGIRAKGKKSSSDSEDESWDEPEEEAGEEEAEPLRKQMGNLKETESSQEPPGNLKETESSQGQTENLKKAEPPETSGTQKVPQETAVRETSGTQKVPQETAVRETSGTQKEPENTDEESWIARIVSRIRGFFAGIRAKIEALKRTVCRIREKLCDIKGFLADENNKIVFPAIWAEVKYLLLHFKFRRIKTDLVFALGDPALTGQALGVISVLPFLYQYQIQISPDFVSEETYVKGTFEIKGYARGVHLLRSAIRLVKKKEFRIWLRKLLDR